MLPLPKIRITVDQLRDEVVLSVPRWTTASVALAFRIAARSLEGMAAAGLPIVAPSVTQGRHSTCAVLEYKLGSSSAAAYAGVIREAAEDQVKLRGPGHFTGLSTHAVEVAS